MTDDKASIDSDTAEVSLRVYELGYHIVPTVEEAQLDSAVATIRSSIEKISGSFITEGAPVSMKLAYAMTKREGDKNIEYDRGYFGWIKFEALPEAITSLEEALKANPQILRYITFRTVREDTRAQMKAPTLREVRRTDTIKSSPRHVEDTSIPVSEVDLDKALDVLTTE
jgi:ribosomal protein S6